MNCPVCGKEKVDDRPFCGGCGHKFGASVPATNPVVETPVAAPAPAPVAAPTPAPQPAPPVYTPPVYTPVEPQIPSEYKPLGAWMYFLWSLLFSIPTVGLVLLIVMSCGASHNINLRNYARSYFCGLLVAVIAIVVFVILALVMGASLGGITEEAFRNLNY